ncbi:hypothetical protein ACFLZQ_08525 [Thermodesulfobacteriota bacterium]
MKFSFRVIYIKREQITVWLHQLHILTTSFKKGLLSPLKAPPPDLIAEKNHEPYDDGWPQYEEPSVTIH